MKYLRHLKYLLFEPYDKYHWQYYGWTEGFYIVRCRCGLQTLERKP